SVTIDLSTSIVTFASGWPLVSLTVPWIRPAKAEPVTHTRHRPQTNFLDMHSDYVRRAVLDASDVPSLNSTDKSVCATVIRSAILRLVFRRRMASRRVAGGRARSARPPEPRTPDFPTAVAVAEGIHAAWYLIRDALRRRSRGASTSARATSKLRCSWRGTSSTANAYFGIAAILRCVSSHVVVPVNSPFSTRLYAAMATSRTP